MATKKTPGKIKVQKSLQGKQPGREYKMKPKPDFEKEEQAGSGKLKDKTAIITGGDSGIGRAVSVAFAKEGANVAIVYLEEEKDANETKKYVEDAGGKCLLIKGDVSNEDFCYEAVEMTIEEFGALDILVNNAAVQFPQEDFLKITAEQLERTFRVNIFGYFWMAQASMKYLKKGSSIINTASVTAYRGSGHLIDYASTKGAIVAFTRSLAESLAEKEIRVNAVAPGPIWTPLIPATFKAKQVKEFGKDTLMKRPGQPEEVAPCYVFLASSDGSYFTGQVLHPNGGEIVNG